MDKLIEWGCIGVLKFLFEYLTSSFPLFEDPVKNYISMTVVALLGFLIAWNIVGKLYSYDIIEGGFIGRVMHWTIRLGVFNMIWFVFATIIRIINWILKVPTFVWYYIVGVAMLIGIFKIVSWRKSLIK